jgi:hypothetical protein
VRVQLPSLLLAAAVAAPTALADDAVGRWRFETGEVSGCTLAGEMMIEPGPGAKPGSGALACRFEIVQTCPGSQPVEIRTAQSCTGRQVNAYVEINSKVEKILSVKPESRRAGVEERYAPDNFRVSIRPSDEEMTGTFVSIGQAFVRFVRVPDLSS